MQVNQDFKFEEKHLYGKKRLKNRHYGLRNRNILSIIDILREELEEVFGLADRIEYLVKKKGRLNILSDKVIGLMFFQPSTRTRLSFETAVLRLGGLTTGFADSKVSRAGDKYKETMADTARVIENYFDMAIIRHYENGVPAEFAKYADIPVINAGDGNHEHPTQAMLELYTIRREIGRLDNIKVLIVSGMKDERVIPSFLYGLSKFENIKVYLMAPENLKLNDEIRENLTDYGLDYDDVESIEEVISEVDVIYSCEILEKRCEQKTPESYIINAEKVRMAKKNMIILHPLPRLDELNINVDNLHHAKYFLETKYGLLIRMALLVMIFGREEMLIV